MLQCAEHFQIHDYLRLTHVRIIPNELEFTFTCRVRRADTEERGGFYGCEFIELSERGGERLLRDIFVLQRQEIQAKRAQAQKR